MIKREMWMERRRDVSGGWKCLDGEMEGSGWTDVGGEVEGYRWRDGGLGRWNNKVSENRRMWMNRGIWWKDEGMMVEDERMWTREEGM